jgi:hypothetical protein
LLILSVLSFFWAFLGMRSFRVFGGASGPQGIVMSVLVAAGSSAMFLTFVTVTSKTSRDSVTKTYIFRCCAILVVGLWSGASYSNRLLFGPFPIRWILPSGTVHLSVVALAHLPIIFI